MTAPTDRNRLDEESSPYLRQHADNPVHWQPWDDTALDAARERDVPIFLSVGYSACHWCHVMEDESFQDDAIADRLNEDFVPIKVDREERPALDSIYQTVCQLVSGRGGWPLSAWLTPDGKPFYVGTYFPPEARRGSPGFGDLLDRIADSWADPEDRREMENRADQWLAAARDQLEDVPSAGADPPGSSILADTAAAIQREADREHGGFGRSGPKFPQPARIDVLLRAAHDEGATTDSDDGAPATVTEAESSTPGAIARETLDAMADGGLYDHVGGGFHRYCTDRDWTVPHFEKMLYDNAELPRVFLAGHQVFGDDRYATVVQETADFLERELRHDAGGFYATIDAQSENADGEHVEGAFYVWTPETVDAAIDADESCEPVDTDLFTDRYGVTDAGNFEHGQTVLTVSASIDSLAAAYDLDPEEVERRLDRARDAVFAARAERARPRRDDKLIAGWNGLAISALATAGIVLDDDRFASLASDALAFARETLWDADAERLHRNAVPEASGDTDAEHFDVRGDGYLEDYAFLARGAFDLYQATGNVDALAFARTLADVVHESFYDAAAGTVFFTPEGGEDLVVRPQEVRDQSTPASLGVACDVLLSLDHFALDDRYERVVADVLESHGARIEASPLEHPTLALVADRYRTGDTECTLACEERPDAWRSTFAETYLPRGVIAQRPPTAEGLAEWLDALDLDDAPPIWADRNATDGEPTAYVCQSRTCSPPNHSLADALAFFDTA
jgi:uncharacterized protein YyaL (SSP411 family)